MACLASLLVGGALAAGALPGCARFETFDLPTAPAHSRSNYQEKEGLTLAAQLVSSPLTSRFHFGPDLRKEGFLPVFVSFENRGKTSFEIQRRSFSIVLENGERLEAVAPQEIFAQVRRSTLPAFIFAPLVFPAIWLHRHLEDYNFYAARTLFEKSLPASLRLEKNDPPLTRAVFFRDPEGARRAQRSLSSSVLQVLVEIEGLRPGETPEPESIPAASTPATVQAAGTSTTPAVVTPTPGGGLEKPHGAPDRVVGRSVTFTVSLSLEDA